MTKPPALAQYLLLALAGSTLLACGTPQNQATEITTVARALSEPVATLCDDHLADATKHCMLGNVRIVRLMNDSSVVVVDDATSVVRIDTHGNRTNIGRKGSGPGEYQLVADVWVEDSTISALDIRQFRAVSFSSAGEALATVSLPMEPSTTDLKLAANKALLLEVQGSDSIGAEVPAKASLFSLNTQSSDGEIAFTAYAVHGKDTDLRPISKPFSPQLLWDMGPDKQVAVTYGSHNTLKVFQGNGSTSITLPFVATPVSDAERDSAAQKLMNPGGRPSQSAAYQEQARQMVAGIASTYPLTDMLRFDSGGRLWVRKGGPAGSAREYLRLDNAGNTPADAITFSADLLHFDARGDLLVTYSVDAGGLTTITLRKIGAQ